ncbi:flagella basal body P-ring formation protein FlgA [bacterium]|jgi:flagella basal body P-ring formation protein FlgA|nr:flagella basal body P-ring formation protein FlgA [bacterium]
MTKMIERSFKLMKAVQGLKIKALQCFIGMILISSSAWAQLSPSWQGLLKKELIKIYPQTEIELHSSMRWIKGGQVDTVKSLTFLGDDSKGNAHFKIEGLGANEVHEGWISYSAWQEGRVALQKIKPGEKLQESYFVKQKLNVAQGLGRELRPLVLSPDTPVEELEAIRTVLQGQPLLSTAVDHVPDVRRGDFVKILIRSGGLSLTTSGLAQESGYMNKKVRVTTSQGKKELLGVLHSKNQVEVEL